MIKSREADMAELELKERTHKLLSLCEDIHGAGSRIVITGHDSPDADSIISTVMMQKFLEQFNIPSPVKFGTRPDNVTARDMDRLSIMDGIAFGGFR